MIAYEGELLDRQAFNRRYPDGVVSVECVRGECGMGAYSLQAVRTCTCTAVRSLYVLLISVLLSHPAIVYSNISTSLPHPTQ